MILKEGKVVIVGTGIDIIEISRIKHAYEKNEKFAERVLTDGEIKKFHSFVNHRKYEYLAGRFAVKEAFSKAMGTGIGKVGFHDIEVLNMEKTGQPYINKSPFDGNVFVSISHSKDIACAQIILEE